MPGKCPSGIKEWLTRVSSIVMLECLQLKVLWNKCVKCLICKRQEMFNSGRRKVMIGKLFQFLASSSSASFFLLHLEPTQRKTISNQEDTPAWAAPIGSDWASHIHIASPTLSSQFSTVTRVIFFKCRFYDPRYDPEWLPVPSPNSTGYRLQGSVRCIPPDPSA